MTSNPKPAGVRAQDVSIVTELSATPFAETADDPVAARPLSITLRNADLQVTALPQLGGKLVSLLSRKTGREVLLPPHGGVFHRRSYGEAFAANHASGFDECFPTVSECEYPAGRFRGARLPDHGEVWSQAWQHEVTGQELWMTVTGQRLPYRLRKCIRLVDNAVVLDYELESLADAPFQYLWSAHPLLQVTPGCRILLPPGVKEVFVQYSGDGRLGPFGGTSAWPRTRLTNGVEKDISLLGDRAERTADKLFTPKSSQACCALYYPEGDESVSFHCDPGVVPYIGIWICQGGWPDPASGDYTVALEPCSARPDSLAEAIRRRECQDIQPGAKKCWSLRVQIQRGVPEPLVREA